MATLQRVFGHAQPKNVYIAAHTAVAFDQAKSTLLLRPGEEMVLELVRSPAAWAFRALQVIGGLARARPCAPPPRARHEPPT